MIFKIKRFAVPTVNWWTVTCMHIFLYFFFSPLSQASTECFPKTGTKLSCPLLFVNSYMMITMYRIQMVYWLL